MNRIKKISFIFFFSVTSIVHAQRIPANEKFNKKPDNDPKGLFHRELTTNFGDDLSIISATVNEHSKMVARQTSLMFKQEEIPCNPSMDQIFGSNQFIQLKKQAIGASESFLCTGKIAHMINPYSAEYCENVNACASIIMGDMGLGLGAGTYIQKILADDYLQTELTGRVHEMEKMENISKFMKQKFPNSITSSCYPKFFDALDKSCLDMVNSIFKKTQDNCQFVKNHCYSIPKNGFMSYKEFEEKNKGTYLNTFTMYFNQRTDHIVNNAIKTEESATAELLNTLTGTESDAVKEEKFYKMLLSLEMSDKLDPIITFYPSFIQYEARIEEAKKRFGNFVSMALKNNSSIFELNNSFNKVRADLGNSLMNNNCDDSPSYESLCVSATNIHAGTKGNKVKTDHQAATVRRTEEVSNQNTPRLNSIAALFSKNDEAKDVKSFSNLDKSMMLLENARCKSFEFEHVSVRSINNKKSTISEIMKGNSIELTRSMLNNPSRKIADVNERFLDNRIKLSLARERIKQFHEELENPNRSWDNKLRNKEDLKLKSRVASILPKIADVSDASSHVVNKTEGRDLKKDEIKNDSNNANNFRNSNQDYTRWQATQPSILNPQIAAPITAPVAAADTQKVSTPVEKTESEVVPVSKIETKKTSTLANKDSKHKAKDLVQTKMIADSKSSLEQLKNLRDELSSLKETLSNNENQSTQLQQVSKGQAEIVNKIKSQTKTILNSDKEDYSKSSAEVKDETNAPVHSSQFQKNAGNQAANSSANNTGSSSERIVASVPARPDVVKASISASSKSNEHYALILNSQESTAEQNEQSIVENILSTNGKSFEVMMDGVSVKIVPLVEKGKLVFVRGKPKYQIVLNNKEEKISKAPKSVGDLKQQQEAELKRASDRAQYQKLKEISGRALNSK